MIFLLSLTNTVSESEANPSNNLIMRRAGLSTWPSRRLMSTSPLSESISTNLPLCWARSGLLSSAALLLLRPWSILLVFVKESKTIYNLFYVTLHGLPVFYRLVHCWLLRLTGLPRSGFVPTNSNANSIAISMRIQFKFNWNQCKFIEGSMQNYTNISLLLNTLCDKFMII